MKERKNAINTNLILKNYLLTLRESGVFIPAWLKKVDFVEDKNLTQGYAYASAEANCIYYRPDATEHAIVHELDHLRSRHNNYVIGYDEEFEKNVKFYFVGFRLGGFTGTFIEEGFNELSSRRVYLKMLKNEPEKRKATAIEYRDQKYYNFEMFTCIGLCALLGANVDELSNLKFSGDTLGQDTIKKVVAELTGKPGYWDEMQSNLDAYQIAKRMIVGKKDRDKFQKEHMQKYYNNAYQLLFLALENGNISKEDFKKRLRLFEFYTRRSGEYAPEIANMVFKSKKTAVESNKRVLTKKLLVVQQQGKDVVRNNQLGSFINLDMPEVYPAVTISLPEMLKGRLLKQKVGRPIKCVPLVEESSYGLF